MAKASAAQDLQLAFYAAAKAGGYDAGGTRCRRSWPGRTPRPSWPRWPCDVVLNGITGSIGLGPTLAALEAGPDPRAGQQGVARSPAARWCGPPPVARTRSSPSTRSTRRSPSACAAGGPTRCGGSSSPPAAGRSAAARRDELHDVTVEQALAHPTWDMGPVVTINSATLVNKGLELHRGAPALRRPVRPDRRRRAPPVGRALDGGVRRRLDARPGQPAGHAAAHRARPGLAGPGARGGRGLRLDDGGHLGVPAAGRRRLPRRPAGAKRGDGRRHRSGGLQRRQRGLRRRVPRRPAAVHGYRRHRRAGARRARGHERPDGRPT